MSDVTFMILKIVISICAALITAYLVPYIHELKKDKRYGQLLDVIEIAVKAAEQVIGDGKGALKKSEVTSYVNGWLKNAGLKITDDQLEHLIEAAVYAMKQEAAYGE